MSRRHDDELEDGVARRYGLRSSRGRRSRRGRERRRRAEVENDGGWERLLPPVVAVLGVAVILAVAGLPPFADPEFALERISVEGQERVTLSEIVTTAALRPGMPMDEVDVEAVEERLRAHPWILEAQAMRLPPRRILVGIREREPLGWTRAGEGAEALLLDAAGTPFAPAEAADLERLPELVAPRPPRPSEPHPEFARALELARALAGAGVATLLRITLPEQPREALRVQLRDLAPTLWLDHVDLPGQIARLQELLDAALPETTTAAEIDLRFADRAVLRGVSPPPGGDV